MSAFYDIMSVFFGWQIICYLCAGLIIESVLDKITLMDYIPCQKTYRITQRHQRKKLKR